MFFFFTTPSCSSSLPVPSSRLSISTPDLVEILLNHFSIKAFIPPTLLTVKIQASVYTHQGKKDTILISEL